MPRKSCLICKLQDFELRASESEYLYMKRYYEKTVKKTRDHISKLRSIGNCHCCSNDHLVVAKQIRVASRRVNQELIFNKRLAIKQVREDLAKFELILASTKIQSPTAIDKINRLEATINKRKALLSQRLRRLRELESSPSV